MILRDPANALDERMRTVWAIEGALAVAVLALLVTAAAVVLAAVRSPSTAWPVGLGGAVVAILGAIVFVWLLPRHYHHHFRYEVTELGLYVARGWLWRRWQVVPHARIETVDIKSGPLLRAFGLVSVEVATAAVGGGTGIPGLAPSEADELVAELARRAGEEES